MVPPVTNLFKTVRDTMRANGLCQVTTKTIQVRLAIHCLQLVHYPISPNKGVSTSEVSPASAMSLYCRIVCSKCFCQFVHLGCCIKYSTMIIYLLIGPMLTDRSCRSIKSHLKGLYRYVAVTM